MKKIILLTALVFSGLTFSQKVTEPKNSNKEWSQPTEPFRIVGDLYYVGTYDLCAYLVVTEEGYILINTGLADSYSQIKNNIKKLGFDYKKIKILTLTQGHYDHMGAMAAIKKDTKAKLYVDAKDADVLRLGGKSDYELGKYGVSFKPVKPDFLLKDQDKIKLGNAELTLLHHPGHTKGSCSFLLQTQDDNGIYNVLIANMPSIIVDRKFGEIHDYKEIEKDYAYTLDAMKKVEFDIWLASHASQFNLHQKRKDGDAYNPKAFMDRESYLQALGKLDKEYREKIVEDSKK